MAFALVRRKWCGVSTGHLWKEALPFLPSMQLVVETRNDALASAGVPAGHPPLQTLLVGDTVGGKPSLDVLETVTDHGIALPDGIFGRSSNTSFCN